MSTGRALAMLPFFVRDYIAATRSMSLAERGAYTDLLFAQWEIGSLPHEPERLARMISCSAEEFEAVWPVIGRKFRKTSGRLLNLRLEEHRAKALSLLQKKAEAGKAGGKASGKQRAKQTRKQTGKQTGSKTEPIASGLLENSQEFASHFAEANTQAKTNSPSPSPDSGVPFGNSRARARGTTVRPNEFQQQVIDAYHRLLPDLPRVKAWTRRRQSALQARVAERTRDGKPADGIGYWEEFFGQVAASDFLCGRSGDFRCDLEWLLRPENFLKVIEGRYENASRANGGRRER